MMIPSLDDHRISLNIQFWIFIYKRKKKKKKREKGLIVVECFVGFRSFRFESWNCVRVNGGLTKFWKEVLRLVFGGTRRITTCPRGLRACVRDGSRLTKRLLGPVFDWISPMLHCSFRYEFRFARSPNWFVEWVKASEDARFGLE